MDSLFSIFDPSSFLSMPLNWLSVILVGVITPIQFWVVKNQMAMSASSVLISLAAEFRAIVGKSSLPGMLIPSISVFCLIWLNNFLGLAPYVFTGTSHLALSLSLALPLWVGHVMYAWVKTPTNSFAHLVPLGSPLPLSPFMVLIELVSSVIRPITLSVRLAANMVAGHLLMVLLSSPLPYAFWPLASLILMALVLLALLESAVATIQAYVFSILSVLYVNEVQAKELN